MAPRELVGRHEALDGLADLVADLSAGRTGAVVLTGPAGAGKTALAGRAATLAEHAGACVARAWGRLDAPPLDPWRSIVAGLGLPEALVVGRASPLERAPAPDGWSDRARLSDRHRRDARLVDALLECPDGRPRLLVLDDLQWFDPASLRVLVDVVRRADGSPLGLVLAGRDHGPTGSEVTHLLRAEVRTAARFELGALDRDDVAQLVAQVLGRAVPDRWADAIRARSGGIPWFVVELARVLSPVLDGRVDADLPDELPEGLPTSVVGLVASELDRLATDERDTVEAAAVVGVHIDVDLVADVTDRAPAVVLDHLDAAGTLVRPAVLGPAFEHALARDAVVGSLPAGRRRRLHQRAAEALAARGDAERWTTERATHLLAAYPLVGAPAVIGGLLAAADEAARRLASEDEARWCGLAVEIDGRARALASPDRVDLLVRCGRAHDRAGDRPEAVRVLDEALEAARSIDDPWRLAAAALARPPHHEVVDNAPLGDLEQVAALTEALDALDGAGAGSEDEVSEASQALVAAVAAELAIALYWSGPSADRAGDVRASAPRRGALADRACAAAARTGDDAVALDAALARLLATWGPSSVGERRRTVASLRSSPSVAPGGDDHRRIALGRWQVLGALEDGDLDGAARLVDEVATLVARTRSPVDEWQVARWRATLACARGRLAEAERLAGDAADLGATVVGEATALDSASVLVSLVRHLQGRGAETADAVAALSDDLPEVPAWRIGVLAAHLAGGRLAEASAEWRLLAADGFAAVPDDLNWVHTMHLLALYAPWLGSREEQAQLRTVLAPHGDRFAVQAFGNAVYGSIARALAGLDRALGDRAAAEEGLRRAVDACTQVPVFLPGVIVDLAEVLLDGAGPARRAEAARLLADARERADALGLRLDRDRADANLAGLGRSTTSSTAAPDGPSSGAPRRAAERTGACRRQGDRWTIALDERPALSVPDGKGVRVLAALLAAPGREIPVQDLALVADGDNPRRRPAPTGTAEPGHLGPTIDATARAAYRTRIAELQGELDEAEAWGDDGRAARSRVELDALVEQLAAGTGLGGRDRSAGSSIERTRVRITKMIRRTLDRLATSDPALASHLHGAIRTGTWCTYEPDPSAPVSWDVQR